MGVASGRAGLCLKGSCTDLTVHDATGHIDPLDPVDHRDPGEVPRVEDHMSHAQPRPACHADRHRRGHVTASGTIEAGHKQSLRRRRQPD